MNTDRYGGPQGFDLEAKFISHHFDFLDCRLDTQSVAESIEWLPAPDGMSVGLQSIEESFQRALRIMVFRKELDTAALQAIARYNGQDTPSAQCKLIVMVDQPDLLEEAMKIQGSGLLVLLLFLPAYTVGSIPGVATVVPVLVSVPHSLVPANAECAIVCRQFDHCRPFDVPRSRPGRFLSPFTSLSPHDRICPPVVFLRPVSSCPLMVCAVQDSNDYIITIRPEGGTETVGRNDPDKNRAMDYAVVIEYMAGVVLRTYRPLIDLPLGSAQILEHFEGGYGANWIMAFVEMLGMKAADLAEEVGSELWGDAMIIWDRILDRAWDCYSWQRNRATGKLTHGPGSAAIVARALPSAGLPDGGV